MFDKIKLLIKKILPASKNQINVKFNSLNKSINNILNQLDANNRKTQQLFDAYTKLSENFAQQISELRLQTANLEKNLIINEDTQQLVQQINVSIKDKTHEISDQMNIVRNEIIQTKRASKESVWGEIFRDTIVQSDWLKNKCFYPGRWAVGYQYLYALYRILNSTRPQHILELGLGQSTTMITQYADSFNNIIHRVTEHDDDWIHYYQKEFKISNNTQIIQLNIEKILYLSQYELFHYENFKEHLGDMKYDLISVDAPFGGADNEYSRIDILEIIPECLADSFVIMIDDANRKGEQHTIKLLEDKLTEQGILFSTGKYVGDKDTYVIASEDKKFVCTL